MLIKIIGLIDAFINICLREKEASQCGVGVHAAKLCQYGSPATTYSLVACCGKHGQSFKWLMNVVVITLDHSVIFVEGVGGVTTLIFNRAALMLL